jgi:hypothetical protein
MRTSGFSFARCSPSSSYRRHAAMQSREALSITKVSSPTSAGMPTIVQVGKSAPALFITAKAEPSVDLGLMANILAGSLPGVWVGSALMPYVAPGALRLALGCTLVRPMRVPTPSPKAMTRGSIVTPPPFRLAAPPLRVGSSAFRRAGPSEGAPTFYRRICPTEDTMLRRNSASNANTAAAAFLRELTPSRRKADVRCDLIVLSER